ncbi:prephenate dehydrogenase [Corynebacterium deserti GIMN1.010]|uniref:Prephenate dehydrogenase n=1 Tax=Corynebacterium deserti GIMN1.010 TaxID=931089 RepID=A0A0M4CE18_9CORY|nr:prephenate dehydrogenase [Corynebacterium deserti]ALC04727.1 prephenate dehydrogenase [Corynebacterium deserti GIMN1.010]
MTTKDISRPVCILGLGLIGGSLLRDLHAANHPVFGYNRSRSGAKSAVDEGFDVSADLEATLQRAATEDALIVLAVPMTAVETLLDAILTHAPNNGFTDVVSVKTAVYDAVKARNMQGRYVGSHPMAGTAKSGWSASMNGLFKRAVWVVTFDQLFDDTTLDSQWMGIWKDVAQMALAVGAEVVPSRVGPHDAAAARVSHLPHILAETLAIVGDNGGALSLSLAAGSYRDSTRVAGTEPALVRAMCEGNADALLKALDEALAILNETRANLASTPPTVESLADNGYRSRIRYEARSGQRRAKESVSPTITSSRPVLRLHPGTPNWEKQLLHAETLGARIEVF